MINMNILNLNSNLSYRIISYSMALISPISSSNGKTFNQKLFSRIRVAIECDVPHIYKLMQQLFVYHDITHLLKSNESSIASGLFNSKYPHLSPVTTLLIEVSTDPFPSCANDKNNSKVCMTNMHNFSICYHNI